MHELHTRCCCAVAASRTSYLFDPITSTSRLLTASGRACSRSGLLSPNKGGIRSAQQGRPQQCTHTHASKAFCTVCGRVAWQGLWLVAAKTSRVNLLVSCRHLKQMHVLALHLYLLRTCAAAFCKEQEQQQQQRPTRRTMPGTRACAASVTAAAPGTAAAAMRRCSLQAACTTRTRGRSYRWPAGGQALPHLAATTHW